MEDLKRNIGSGSIIGVDRTFNLVSCYVTSIVYKQRAMVHIESGESPLFLGPMYLHWDGEFKTYHAFFAYIKSELLERVSNIDLKIGSDQEAGLTKALKSCFPDSKRILCARHTKENVSRYLSDRTGCSSKERQNIINRIFGKGGILLSTEQAIFDRRAMRFMESIVKYQSFKHYFNEIKPLLHEYVFLLHLRGESS